MSIVSMIHQSTKLQSADAALIEKAGWALKQRLRKQMNQLAGSFFDEVDDFIFEAGKQGQFTEGSDYFGAMREIRAKQVLFEETFLNAVSEYLDRAPSRFDVSQIAAAQSCESPVIFESMEVELAISTMARKASKYYSPYMKQIESLISLIEAEKEKHLIRGNSLVSSVVSGFIEAQGAIKIDLEIRLVFMKLFEQHFFMKMEKLFLDSISILNNIDNKQFVDRLYSSSSSFHVPVASSCTPSRAAQHSSATAYQQIKPDSKAVESSVNDVLSVIRTNKNLPRFVEEMAEQHWRMVLLLIGLNKGVASLEWQEAEHVFQLLVLCTAGQVETSRFDETLLIEKISQGLRLLRISGTDEAGFVDALKEHFAAKPVTSRTAIANGAAELSPRIEPEATVSPSGASILDADDLNEIAQLINGEPVNDDYAESEEKAKLLDGLSSVDGMSACSSAQLLIKGKLHDCVVTRSGAARDVFVITNTDSKSNTRKIALTRSRLGMAISLRRGEILLADAALKPSACNITVFERKS